MSWIDPIVFKREFPRPRVIEVNGVHYSSIRSAERALGCSATKIYRLIGEAHRDRDRKRS